MHLTREKLPNIHHLLPLTFPSQGIQEVAGQIEKPCLDSKSTLALRAQNATPVSDLHDPPSSSSRGHDLSPSEGPAVPPPVAVSAVYLASGGTAHPYWQDLSDWLAAAYRPSKAQVDTAFAILRNRSEMEGCIGAVPLELIRGIIVRDSFRVS